MPKYVKPTVEEALREQEAKFTVTVKPASIFKNWRTYMIRYKIAMFLMHIISWLTAIPYEVKEEDDE